jgi:hypothetical protein
VKQLAASCFLLKGDGLRFKNNAQQKQKQFKIPNPNSSVPSIEQINQLVVERDKEFQFKDKTHTHTPIFFLVSV